MGSYGDSESRLPIRHDTFTRPPSISTYRIRALVSDCDPPRGIGHPTACAEIAIRRPKMPDKGSSRLRKECAARPANRARVRSLRKWWAVVLAESGTDSAKRAISHGCLGIDGMGRRNSGAN